MTDDRETIAAWFEHDEIQKMQSAIADIDRMLDAFAEERLTPKMVEEILRITTLERLRWNKDCRLPKSGTGSFRKGRQLFQFYLHPVSGIAKLAAHPETIEAWREADAKTKALTQAQKAEPKR